MTTVDNQGGFNGVDKLRRECLWPYKERWIQRLYVMYEEYVMLFVWEVLVVYWRDTREGVYSELPNTIQYRPAALDWSGRCSLDEQESVCFEVTKARSSKSKLVPRSYRLPPIRAMVGSDTVPSRECK